MRGSGVLCQSSTVPQRIDLDSNATTPLDPRVRAAMYQAMDELPGNPSSIHAEGRRARDAIEKARAEVALLIGAAPNEIVFTSGGTESDQLGMLGLARAARGPRRVVTSPLEHPAVAGALGVLIAEGVATERVSVDAAGRIDPADVAQQLKGGAALASFALANHELGNVYDVSAFAQAAHTHGTPLHCDAVQAVGKLPFSVETLGADTVALSAHKLHGPKGVGALWIRRGVGFALGLASGHQERGFRPGTENVIGIVGFGVAARVCREEWKSRRAHLATLRDRLEQAALAIAGARRHGDAGQRVDNTTNLGFSGVPGDLLVAALDLEGIAASTGAACSSGSVEASPVIRALGLSTGSAAEAVRFSLGTSTTDADIARLAELLPMLVARIRAV